MEKKVAVTILNYNNWPDTLLCAESLLKSDPQPEWLIIVDNASTNASVAWLHYWAQGKLDFFVRENGMEPVPKPLELGEEECGISAPGKDGPSPMSVLLIKRTSNDGYAAGNNAGISRALALGADAVWILNNDTVVAPHAFGAMREKLFSKPNPGLCGSLVRYMDNKACVQCRAGGYANKWTGLSVLDGNRKKVAEAMNDSADSVEQRINFIYGASVMASKAFIENVGLLDDRFFLYSEEQDWAYRAARAVTSISPMRRMPTSTIKKAALPAGPPQNSM